MTRVRLAGVVAALACTLLLASSAYAAFPGKNGKIAFQAWTPAGNNDIYSMNPDGSGVTNLTNNPASDIDPDWSPDGSKIAFATNRDPSNPDCNDFNPCNSEIYVMNADGSGQTRITNTISYDEGMPSWTPDGRQITFSRTTFCGAFGCDTGVYTMNADGTGAHAQFCCTFSPAWSPSGKKLMGLNYNWDFPSESNLVTANPDGSGNTVFCCNDQSGYADHPDWSPDASAAVFEHGGVARKNLDGTGYALLQPGASSPAWSPDGKQIAFVAADDVTSSQYAMYVMNADGTGKTKISGTTSANAMRGLTWQPIPINGYARPKGATPFLTNLTVAYKPCASPNEQHGSPLAVLSCSPPQQASDFLTVGTLDSNGQKANAIGSVRYDVKPGTAANPADDADVKMTVSIKDVRLKDLSDYAGELQITSSRRITDKLNTPAPDGTTQAATTQDTPLSLTVPCAPTTADNTIGSLCALSTSADAVVPGQVAEGARSNWELGQIKVYDGGADQDADTAGDNTLFMDEGIFVP